MINMYNDNEYKSFLIHCYMSYNIYNCMSDDWIKKIDCSDPIKSKKIFDSILKNIMDDTQKHYHKDKNYVIDYGFNKISDFSNYKFYEYLIKAFPVKGIFVSIYKELIPYSVIIYDWVINCDNDDDDDYDEYDWDVNYRKKRMPIFAIDLDMSNVHKSHKKDIITNPNEYLVSTLDSFVLFEDLQKYLFCCINNYMLEYFEGSFGHKRVFKKLLFY